MTNAEKAKVRMRMFLSLEKLVEKETGYGWRVRFLIPETNTVWYSRRGGYIRRGRFRREV
jgi:hypothetical protein